MFFNSLLLLPYVIIIRIHSIIYPFVYFPNEGDTLLTKKVFGFINLPWSQGVLAILLIYFHVLFINRLVIKHRIANEITLLPGLIYAVLISFLPEYCNLTPYLIANTFILIGIGQIFKTYKRPQSADIIFNVGFLIAMASLFVPQYIILLLVGLIGLFIMRSMKMAEILQLISGSILVYSAYCGVLYLSNYAILPELNKISLIPRLSILELRGAALYKVAAIVLVSLYAVINYGRYTLKKSIQTQKKVDILYWFMIASMLILLISPNIYPGLVLLLFIPISIFLNINFLNIKSILIQELLHIAILAALFAFHFGLI